MSHEKTELKAQWTALLSIEDEIQDAPTITTKQKLAITQTIRNEMQLIENQLTKIEYGTKENRKEA